MSLQTLSRLLILALICPLLAGLLWNVAGAWPLLVGPGLLLLALGYLALTSGSPPLTRWQLRYHLPLQAGMPGEVETSGQSDGVSLDRLEDTLHFLAARSSHLVLEACDEGLFLELPEAFDRYIEVQLPRVLPKMKLSQDIGQPGDGNSGDAFYLSIGSPNNATLRWATEQTGRQVRAHIHSGPYVTLTARSNGSCPPGRWMRVPVPSPLRGLWHHLPVWDELSYGFKLSHLLPPTDDGAVYSSRSRLLRLNPPQDYQADETQRVLGRSMDGRSLTLDHTIPVFSIGAPASFLAGQIAGDLARGGTVVVVSPDRRFLDTVRYEVGGAAVVQWLDPQNSQASARLGIVAAQAWEEQDTELVVQLMQSFLQDLGLDVDLPVIEGFTQSLLYALVGFSREGRRALTFSDLYAVSQSAQALQVFLADLQRLKPNSDPAIGHYIQGLLQQMSEDEGYVQVVTILSAIRSALAPLRSGPLYTICQGSFFSANGASPGNPRLLLVPMTNVDFPEHDRLLSAMLDLTLNRTLQSHRIGVSQTTPGTVSAVVPANSAQDDLRVALHLHDPHLYRYDGGQRWINIARRDARLSLLLNVKDPDAYSQIQAERWEGELVFDCSEALATSLIGDWNLPASVAEMQELPVGVAIARLNELVAALEVER